MRYYERKGRSVEEIRGNPQVQAVYLGTEDTMAEAA